MKKVFIMLMCVLVLPFNVFAVADSETFRVGDAVIALVENDTTRLRFDVIRESKAGDPYVWLMYEGTVTTAMYDEELPGDHEATGIFANGTLIYEKFSTTMAKWDARTEEMRLPLLEDFTALGVQKNSTSGKYEIKYNLKYLAPKAGAGMQSAPLGANGYNYWTGSCVDDKCTGENVQMYVATYKEDNNGQAGETVATLEPTSLDKTFAIRPVIKVDKKYIDCNLSTPTNPPTSQVTLPIEYLAVAVIAGAILIVVRKKEIFTQI